MPGFGQVEIERVLAESEIGGQRAQQRGVLRRAAAAGAGERDQQFVEPRTLGALAEDVQPVADLQFLELAQQAVELAQCRCRVLAGDDAAIAVEPGRPRLFEDRRREHRDAPRIAVGSLVIFVDQALELGHQAIAAGAGQRRGQMVDDHRLRAALGLAALAGIVDDERIEMRQWRQHRLGEAFGRQRQRLARQPFEGAVLAEMNDRIGAEILSASQA